VEQGWQQIPVVVNALLDIIVLSQLLEYLEVVQIRRNHALLESSALLEQGVQILLVPHRTVRLVHLAHRTQHQ
jgi:hypothetical protein